MGKNCKAKAVLVQLVPVIGFIALNLLGGYLCSRITGDPIVGTILGDCIVIGAAGFWYWYMREPFHDKAGDVSWPTAFLYGAVFIILYVGSQVGSLWVGVLFPGTLETYYQNVEVNAVAYMLLTVLVAPLAEEMMFRGVCYAQLRKLWGPVPACLLSTLVFAFFHSTPSQVYLAVMCGLVFCVVHELTGSLFYSVVMHLMYNVSCFIVGSVPVNNLYVAIAMQVVAWGVIAWLYVKVIKKAHKEVIAES